MMPSTKTFYELKEKAKWSLDPQEKKTAIRELSSSYGEEALQVLEEILNVTAYKDVKAACLDAIKAIREKEAGGNVIMEEKVGQSGSISDSVAAASTRTAANATAKTSTTTMAEIASKKKEKVVEGEAEKKAAEVTAMEAK